MDCSLGDIDLNRLEVDPFGDGEMHAPNDDDGVDSDVMQQEGGEETGVNMDSTAQTQPQEEKALEHPEKTPEEPEEGEISDDNERAIPESAEIPESDEKEDTTLQSKEPSYAVAKNAMASFSRWPSRSNGNGRQGGWKLQSEASAYSGQPDRFYQFAWAKGVQGVSKDGAGDSSQEENLIKSGRTSDNSPASALTLHRSGSTDTKGGWIVGDRGIEYVSFLQSDDGYLYLQDGGDRSDQRRGESRRGRSDRESAERTSKSDDKYRNQSDGRKDHRRRLESGRSSRDRKRENRGEGDLEEGELEGKKAMLGGRGFGEQSRHGKSRDWESCTLESSNSKDRGAYDSPSESHIEKLFADIAEHVRNVSVRDAQRSFLGVCRQLRRGLRGLRDLSKDLSQVQGKHIESQQRKVLALTRDVFSGIRAAYAVRNTAIGKEQEQDTNTFPRLLELARSRCHGLFSSKQIQELESMMQAIGYRGRMENVSKTYRRGCSSYESGRGEEKDLRLGESSGNTSATTQLESESTTDTYGDGKTLDRGDEAEQPSNPSRQLHSGEVPVVHPVNDVDNSTAGGVGFGGWFSLSSEQDVKEAALVPPLASENVMNLNNDQVKGQPQELHGRDTSGDNHWKDTHAVPKKDLTMASHLDPVRALTSYHEKFAGKSQTTYTQLPSPTPSEEDNAVANNTIENSSSGANFDSRDGQPTGTDKQLSGLPEDTQVSLLGSVALPVVNPLEDQTFSRKGGHVRRTLSELSLFPSLETPTMEGSSDGFQSKLVPSRGPKKSRDPRIRMATQVLDLDLSQSDKNGLELSDSKAQWSDEGVPGLSRDLTSSRQQSPQTSQGSTLVPKGELVSLLTLATGGGWLAEQQMGRGVVVDVPIDMDVVDAGSHTSWDSTGSLQNEGSQKKRHSDFLNQEVFSKRPKFAATASAEDDYVPQLKVAAELQAGLVGAVAGDTKHGGESPSLQGEISSRQSASVSESTINDASKLRMKPRDPRRVLLGASKGNPAAPPPSSGASNLVSREGKGALLPTMPAHNALDKLSSAANTAAVPQPNLLARTGSGLPPDFSQSNINNSNNRPIEPPRATKPSGMEMKGSLSKPLGMFDLNLSAAANHNKHKEHIGHWDQLEPLLQGLDEKQKQVVRQERARRIEEQSRMFVAKKLCLVLDLDHTLLNSAKFTEIESEWEAKLQANELTERQKFGDEGSHRRELYRFQHMGMWTKLRPGIWNFLARASHLYELHVYTMGNKAYATEMAKLLDPTGKLFAGRVISKGDDGDIVDGDERLPKSKDLEGVLGMESAVVIIDDSARVWPHHRHNLIVVERYMYFPCSRKQFGLPGPSLLEVGHDEREQDGMLASALMVIEKIHYSFFSNPRLHEVDVRDILAKEQRRVLAGCKLIFSRVFPQGEIQPHLHPLWQLAEQFGAVCSMAIDEGVTHVVAISLGTEKVNWAITTGRFVVRPSWVEASAILYRRANERDFSITV